VLPGRDVDIGLLRFREVENDGVEYLFAFMEEVEADIGLEAGDDVKLGPLDARLFLRFPERSIERVLSLFEMPLWEIPISAAAVEEQEFHPLLGLSEDNESRDDLLFNLRIVGVVLATVRTPVLGVCSFHGKG
jgi:hypothetical protein